jgi:hypothetical protein
MGSGGSGKGPRRGSGRRRSRGGRPGGGGGGGQGGNAPNKKGGAPAATHSPRKGKAFSTPYEVPETGPIEAFDLFCACLLGLMPDGSYRGAGLGEVAKRLRRSPNEVRDLLKQYGMDTETLKTVDFDLSLAKLDIQVAPEGIDRRELARGLFEEFVDVHPALGPEALAAPSGNGTAPAAAHPHHRHSEAPAETAEPEAEESDEVVEADAVAEAEAEEAAPEGEEEPSLVTADVGRAARDEAEGPAEEAAGQGRRTVRQIRRSPVRRGR